MRDGMAPNQRRTRHEDCFAEWYKMYRKYGPCGP
jgi:hypothetical protein